MISVINLQRQTTCLDWLWKVSRVKPYFTLSSRPIRIGQTFLADQLTVLYATLNTLEQPRSTDTMMRLRLPVSVEDQIKNARAKDRTITFSIMICRVQALQTGLNRVGYCTLQSLCLSYQFALLLHFLSNTKSKVTLDKVQDSFNYLFSPLFLVLPDAKCLLLSNRLRVARAGMCIS